MLNLNLNQLRAVAMHSARKDVRNYLQSVCLQFAEPALYLVATDGHTLMAGMTDVDYTDGEVKGHFTMLIPISAINTALKSVSKKAETIRLSSLPDGRYSLGDTIFAAMTEKFPDWEMITKRAFSSTVDGAVQMDGALLARCQESISMWQGRAGKLCNLPVAHNKDAGLISIKAQGALCIAMGMNVEKVSEPLIPMPSSFAPQAKAA
jgi:hypothetical protein